MPHFNRDNEIFCQEDVLREDYQPEKLQERDAELEEYEGALQPVINGAQPRNIFLYGKTGVGKTAATQYLLNHLHDAAENYDDLDLTTVFLNCNNLNSSYQVAINLVNELRDPQDQISTTGYPQQAVFDMLYEELENIGGTVLIVLDEIDNINNDNILYELPRARANGNLSDVKPGIIGISNDFTFRETLSPKVKDTLCEEEIHFPPYNADELQNILSERADAALYDDVLDQDVLPLCSAFAAQDTGSARQSLKLLYKAGDLARKEGTDSITEEHVREAQHTIERGRVEEGMKKLTTQGHLALFAVVSHALEGKTPVRSRDIYPRYKTMAEQAGTDPLVRRRMNDHLSDLSMQGILTVYERNEGRAGGSYYDYELDVPTQLALTVLEEIERIDVPQSVRHQTA